MPLDDRQALVARIAALEAENTELRGLRSTAPHPAEASLRESEANWRSLVECIPDFVMILAPDGVIRWINRAEPTNRPEDLIGVNVLQFVPDEVRSLVEDAFRKALETGETVEYVTETVVDGHHVWYSSRTTRLTDAPAPGLLLAVARNITEQRRREERLRTLEAAVVHAPDSIMITESEPLDEPGPLIVYVNPAFTAMTGYTLDECRGRSPRFLQGPDTSSAARGVIRAALLARQAVSVELLNYRKDQAPFWNEASITPILNDEGVCTHFVSVHRDLTERKRIEAEKRLIDRRLQDTQRLESIGYLAGGVAHDFNNLLTVILGNTSLARLAPAEPAGVLKCLEGIDQAALRAADLCRQMLAYAGRGRFVVAPLSLSALVRESASLLRSLVSKKALLRFTLADLLPAIEVDATQLKQVLMNLVLNASEALGERGGLITVTTGLQQLETAYLAHCRSFTELPAGPYVFLEVSDNGPGMSLEVQAKIFEPFFSTKFVGRGLGLAAVDGIVRGHQGALLLTSQPGQGTTFRLLLPASSKATAETKGTAAAQPWLGEGVVLVVDDEDWVRSITARILRSAGFEVLEAADGQAAVEQFALEHARIRLVLMDLLMPRLDGAQALRELRRVQPDVQAIVMSGYSEQELTERFADAPPGGYLQKPYQNDQLLSLVARLLTPSPD